MVCWGSVRIDISVSVAFTEVMVALSWGASQSIVTTMKPPCKHKYLSFLVSRVPYGSQRWQRLGSFQWVCRPDPW